MIKRHTNPNLRAANTVPGEPVTKGNFAVLNSKSANLANKPPVFELQDKKWRVEYQVNNHNLLIDETDLKQSIYIYKCNECTVTVKGKVNSIILDSCSRVGLLFDDVLATVEFINSSMVQMQVLGKVPTVSIDKTDGCQVYLSRHSLDVEIVSSKSSSMNILIPNEHDDDYSEQPVPEQFKTVINRQTKKLATTATEMA
jgi:adenylyl cyclase-associated protein